MECDYSSSCYGNFLADFKMKCQRLGCDHTDEIHSSGIGMCTLAGCRCYSFQNEPETKEPRAVTIIRRIYAGWPESERDMRFVPETIRDVIQYIDQLKARLGIPADDGYYGPMK